MNYSIRERESSFENTINIHEVCMNITLEWLGVFN
jgi:hypothetical protein